MKVLLLGATGQLGQCLSDELKTRAIDFFAPTSQACNLTRCESVTHYFSNIEVDAVVNCAAYTNVDGAESNVLDAMALNADGPKVLAELCRDKDTRLIHISTDYVFDGNSSNPYQTTDTPNPASVYGKSKLDGENYVRTILPNQSWVIRTAWLYSPYGKNFAKTILRNAKKGSELTVVDDSWGQPTNARSLAFQICELLNSDAPAGIYHGTNSFFIGSIQQPLGLYRIQTCTTIKQVL